MSLINNTHLEANSPSREIDTDLLTLDELGAFICREISWYGQHPEYLICKNKHGRSDIILIVDNIIYNYTNTVLRQQDGERVIHRTWNPVKIDIKSIFRRERDGKGISYLPL